VTAVTVYHNPSCGSSRRALDLLADLGVDVEVVRYLQTPPDRPTLERLVAGLVDPVTDLVRRDARLTELGLTNDDVATANQVVDVLERTPALLQRPLVLCGDRVLIGRPVDRIAAFVTGG
jgi:arsenate reductase